jgi:hypothetical protein
VTFKSIPAAINPDKPKMLYSLVPRILPLGKKEAKIITNKRITKKVIYKGNNINVRSMSLGVI